MKRAPGEALHDVGYAKINLALHVRHRRPDGYHDLETLFAFAEDGDGLSVNASDHLSLTMSGPFAQELGSGPDNLVLKAAQALRTAFNVTAGAALHLEKNLPVAAGLGGGSADAAAALRLLSRFWGLDDGIESHMRLAAQLGADVPACLASHLCKGVGVGDTLMAVDQLSLEGTPLLLVNPMLPCPTGPVFKAWDGVDRGPLDCSEWAHARNDLEAPAKGLVPEIAAVLSALKDAGDAQLVRMSGSGATCFALFHDIAARDAAAAVIALAHPQWWVQASRLR